jgi:hypothetical protein
MTRDPIVEEVRAARRTTERACGGDWNRLVEHYRQVQDRSGHEVLRGSPRQSARASAAETSPPGAE